MAERTTQQETNARTGKPMRLLIKGADSFNERWVDAIAVLDGEKLIISGRFKSLDLQHAFKNGHDFSGWVSFNVELHNDGSATFRLHKSYINLDANAETTVNGAPASLFSAQNPNPQIIKVLHDALYQISEGKDEQKRPVNVVTTLSYLHASGEFSSAYIETSDQLKGKMTGLSASTLADAILNGTVSKPERGLIGFLRSHREFGI